MATQETQRTHRSGAMLRTNKGVMAIATSDCGTFAKPFAEAIENIDHR
jgi:ABC-type phosphate/phosphonate transport system permease subunit